MPFNCDPVKCGLNFIAPLIVVLLIGAVLIEGNDVVHQNGSNSYPLLKHKDTQDSTSILDFEQEQFAQQGLKAHNEFRKRHNVSALMINPTICEELSQGWANHLANIGKLEHSQNPRYGENLYWYSGNLTDAGKGVDSWYSEIDKYNFTQPGWHSGTGHFTQVVWKSTNSFCMAKANAKDGSTYFVANYSPPGNFMGQFEWNVFPPLD